MKHLKKMLNYKVLNLIALAAAFLATNSASTCSYYLGHQPKFPEKLLK